MKISIVIPNRKDLRVKNLIENLYNFRGDNIIEIIIALNSPSPELVELTNELKKTYSEYFFSVKSCDAGESGNVSRAYNIGIDGTKYPYALILDSDIIVDKDFFRNLCKWIPSYDVVKAYLNFFEPSCFLSKIINKSRMANTFNVLETFSPGIMFNKDKLKRLLGDKIYDETIKFTGDCDLSMRIRKNNNSVASKKDKIIKYEDVFDVFNSELKNNIPNDVFSDPDYIRVIFNRSAKFYHPTFGLVKDFKDALIYGAERRIIINKKLKKVQPIKNLIISIKDSKRYGAIVCAYNFFWTLTMEIGTFIQKFYNIRDFLMRW